MPCVCKPGGGREKKSTVAAKRLAAHIQTGCVRSPKSNGFTVLSVVGVGRCICLIAGVQRVPLVDL